MSQIFKPATAGSLPPSVPTSFVTDSGTAVPAANILDVFTSTTNANNVNGIQSTGSTNVVTVLLTNTAHGSVTTNDATLTTIITLPLGATPGAYTINGSVVAFDPAGPAGGSYGFTGSFRTDGATATEIVTEYKNELEDAALGTADIFTGSSGNNMLVQVQGVAATTIRWFAKLDYILVT